MPDFMNEISIFQSSIEIWSHANPKIEAIFHRDPKIFVSCKER